MTDEPCMTFTESTVWTFAREIARIAQHPDAPTPEQVANRVLAEVVTARIEVDNDR